MKTLCDVIKGTNYYFFYLPQSGVATYSWYLLANTRKVHRQSISLGRKLHRFLTGGCKQTAKCISCKSVEMLWFINRASKCKSSWLLWPLSGEGLSLGRPEFVGGLCGAMRWRTFSIPRINLHYPNIQSRLKWQSLTSLNLKKKKKRRRTKHFWLKSTVLKNWRCVPTDYGWYTVKIAA